MPISWSGKRKLLYGSVVGLVVVALLLTLFFKFVYHPSSCFDGIQNGDETGIDCGGSCSTLCTNDAIAPLVLWSKMFNISGSLYSAVAYVENPNLNSGNDKATYEFRVYDEKGGLLDTRDGETSIPKNKKFAIIEPGFNLTKAKPKYVEFEFTAFAKWTKDVSPDPSISVNFGPLIATTTAPRIEGTISTNADTKIDRVELTAFVYDGNENVVAASQTYIEGLEKQNPQQFVFTWPKPFNLGVEACSQSQDVMLVLDRSGSMRSESKDPPEPFGTVKGTAEDFVKNLHDSDQVGVVSFGDDAHLESMLSGTKAGVSNIINSLSLSSTSEQTNIQAGLSSALDEILSSHAKDGNKKTIILLTDGAPTEPTKVGEVDYPKTSAQTVATDISSKGISLYTIGLGKDVNEGFLKTISTDMGHYYFAPTKDTLSQIYKNIGSALCQKRPNVISVMYRVF